MAKKLVSHNKIDWSINPKAPNALFLIGGVDISFVKVRIQIRQMNLLEKVTTLIFIPQDSDEDACASLIVLSYPDFKVSRS